EGREEGQVTSPGGRSLKAGIHPVSRAAGVSARSRSQTPVWERRSRNSVSRSRMMPHPVLRYPVLQPTGARNGGSRSAYQNRVWERGTRKGKSRRAASPTKFLADLPTAVDCSCGGVDTVAFARRRRGQWQHNSRYRATSATTATTAPRDCSGACASR